jgi:hypothetical protein
MVTAPNVRPPSSASAAGRSGVRPEHPADVHDALLGGSSTSAHQHVRFRIDPDDGPHTCGERQRQLTCSTAKIKDNVVDRERERVHQCIEHGCGITTPISLIEVGHLATET